MPQIPATSHRRSEPQFDPFTVLAIMAFPRDIQEGNRFVARVRESAVAKLESDLKADPEFQDLPLYRLVGAFFGSLLEPLGGFSVLQGAPAYAEICERAFARTWPGCIAGDLLLNLIQLQEAVLGASVNKAIAIELDFLSDAKTKEGLPGPGRTERYVRKVWEDFKPACHLWAAFRLWSFQDRPASFAPYFPESVPGFLALSQVLLSMAVTLQASNRREPLLPLKDMWAVSRRYELPPVHLRIPPLEDWKMEVLRRKFKSLRD